MAAIQWRTEDRGRAGSMGVVNDIGVTTDEAPAPHQRDCKSYHTLPLRPEHLTSPGDFIIGSDSAPKNNNSATHYDTLPASKRKVETTIRHSFRCNVRRRSMKLLKNLKPSHMRMSSHTKQRNIENLAVYALPADYCVSSCIIDTDDIDKGEVIFFSYSDDGLSYTKHAVPICNAGCKKHRIRWNIESDDDEESHCEDYDSGGEFGECDEPQIDEHQMEEVLADYSLREAPVHVSTLGRLPSSHSFEAMSDEDFTSSFAYCETEHLNTIRRSTVTKKASKKWSSPTSLNSASSRKSRFVANMNRKMTSKAWPLRSLWLFLTRQKDDSHRSRMEDIGETLESATRYIRIASHFQSASISVRVVLQSIHGAPPLLRDVQTDLITTALKAFFTLDDGVDVAWVDDVPTEIQRNLAVGRARVHFAVPDIRQCVACLLLSPDATSLLRRRQCVLLKSIAEVLECREECVVVMQTKPGMTEADGRLQASNGVLSHSHPNISSSLSPPTKDTAVSSLEWMTYIPSFYS